MGSNGSIVLSALEFEVLWAAERMPTAHPALQVPSPGRTHAERAQLVAGAWDTLRRRGLAKGEQASGELMDALNVFAHAKITVDTWVWAGREIRSLAASTGSQAVLGVIDDGQVWLIPARDGSLAEAAVSVAGDLGPGVGRSVSMPHEVLRKADAAARGDAKSLVTALEDRGVQLSQAQELAGMLFGQQARGQLGAERLGRDGVMRRAGRVVAFFDTDAGRYLFQVNRNTDGRDWATVTPADNALLGQRVWELLDEV